MKKIEVDTDMLNNDIVNLRSEIESIAGTTDKMYDDLAILDSGWDGAASSAFNTQFLKDRARLQEIMKTIAGYVENLVQARQEYDAGEANVAQIVAAIRI